MAGRTQPKRKIWLILVVLLPVLLLAAGVWAIRLYGNASAPAAGYDRPEEILAAYDAAAFQGAVLEPDGQLTVRLGKADIYWLSEKYGVLDTVEAQLEELPGMTVTDYGFTIQDGRVTAYLGGRRNLLPVAYQIDFSVTWEGTALSFRPEAVYLGSGTELDASRWPEFLPAEAELQVDLAELGISPALRSARLEGDALVLTAAGLTVEPDADLFLDMGLIDSLRAFGAGQEDSLGILAFLAELPEDTVPMSEALARVLASGDPEGAMADLLAGCTQASAEALGDAADPFTQEMMGLRLEQEAQTRRDALWLLVQGEREKYEKFLTAAREMYKGGLLRICPGGFKNAVTGEVFDLSTLTRTLSAAATDCRLVFLYTEEYLPESVCTGDMPPLGRQPRSGKDAVRGMDLEQVYDLGILMTTEAGMPVLLHYRQDGTFVVREVTQVTYTTLLMSSETPVLCADELEEPSQRAVISSGVGGGYEILLLER